MSAMKLLDKTLCQMHQKSVAKKAPSEYAGREQALMEAGEGNCDWTDQKYIAPILDALE